MINMTIDEAHVRVKTEVRDLEKMLAECACGIGALADALFDIADEVNLDYSHVLRIIISASIFQYDPEKQIRWLFLDNNDFDSMLKALGDDVKEDRERKKKNEGKHKQD